ncbi:MAG TPA: PilN domain-containing protein [Bradyrhizobium sp.]|nr:PilN domain-containing protein [Bradyrhizobium sp.]
MSIPGQIATASSLWIDRVACTLCAQFERTRQTRRILLSEDSPGSFSLSVARTAGKATDLPDVRIKLGDGAVREVIPEAWSAAMKGAVVDVHLLPSRFVFRPLDLPGRAVEFLEGIVRAQVDRLTPWAADDAVFRWTQPQARSDDHVELTVIATARKAVMSLAQPFIDMGAAAVEVSTIAAGNERVMVLRHSADGGNGTVRVRRGLIAVLGSTGLLALLSVGLGGIVTDSYDAEQQQIQRRITEMRVTARGSQASGNTALEVLARRKQTMPSAVMVLEELSAILPDHTHATELRLEGAKIQISGMTADAASLIQVLEQSARLAGAGFFAPTTRAAGEAGERFHIEARIKPQSGSGT